MAFEHNQEDQSLPTNGNEKRQSSELLPKYFRTDVNKKFLAGTLDQLVQPGVAEKLNGYYGRKTAKAFKATDSYITDVSEERQDYQLEPALVIKDNLDNVTFYKEYRDLINQVEALGGNSKNHDYLNSQEYYAWDPHIDWDKFVNFREYYWLPNGPQSLPVYGQAKEVTSTYSVRLQDNGDNFSYVFAESGSTTGNPSLRLFRGQTYRFEIDTPGYPIAFATSRSFKPAEAVVIANIEGVRRPGVFDGTLYDVDSSAYDIGAWEIEPSVGGIVGWSDSENVSTLYNKGVSKTSIDDEGNKIATVYVEKGIVEFTIPEDAPESLYYISKNDINTSGLIKIYDIEENSYINIEEEILDKKTYTSANGIKFSNGMKVYFQGEVVPAKYATDEWYVEGVGSGIKLVREKDLEIPATYSDDVLVPFDVDGFDRVPFENANSYAGTKDYIVINRASQDRNAWSRYNRWFHKDVIKAASDYNNKANNTNIDAFDIDESARAKRPIVEFISNIKLYNFGTLAKQDVDLIDFTTKDAFSIVEGSLGYHIDGVELVDGMRVIFAADPDSFVNGKVFKVEFLTIDLKRQITLQPADDVDPLENETVLVTQGVKNAGKTFYYDGTTWKLGQEKTKINQTPLFDVFDKDGNSYGDITVYPANTFVGNGIFSYALGEGTADTELGFPLKYRTINNTGDILFTFNLLIENYNYEELSEIKVLKAKHGFLRRYSARDEFVYENSWKKANTRSRQYVLRHYIADGIADEYKVDVYTNSASAPDLKVIVLVNNVRKVEGVDYDLITKGNDLFVKFAKVLSADTSIILKTRSTATKNNNGFYEVPINLEKNPLNSEISSFTIGEVNDHVDTMLDEIEGFDGVYPGSSNLRDLGNITPFGRRFVHHSGPFNLALYHLTNQKANVILSVREAKSQYSKFKREFLQVANSLGFEGPVKQHVDKILEEINKSKTSTMPHYFSDMLAYGTDKVLRFTIKDATIEFYSLTEVFNLNTLSNKAVYVYINDVQLVYGKDYEFNEEGFIYLKAQRQAGDSLEIYSYSSTDGSYIPATPSKLGLFPAYQPRLYIDRTYREPTTVIEGHDGSITIAYNDFRDDLLLELEKRIYNNIKTDYQDTLVDIFDFIPGQHRNTKVSREAIDNTILKDFIDWLQLTGNTDYTDISFYDITDPFTFNYSSMRSPDGKVLPGFWRAVYKFAYDTDRPHTHPWEMLGFTAQPAWWEEVYGPAPYTSGNLILWRDLESGALRIPGQAVTYNPRFVRPGLLNHLPVDEYGELLSPLDSGYARGYVEKGARNSFKFGDIAPTEAAWRRSSEYPYALMVAWLLNQPAKILGLGFDTSRIKRNLAGNIVYNQCAINFKDIVFPNTVVSDTRVYTAGFVNFVCEYLTGLQQEDHDEYHNDLRNINNNLSIRVGGFTDKDKFKLILDSRTPYNNGNVFVPEENYQIFLNTSTAVRTLSYSGVIIEKTASGYKISGYDFTNPKFTYYVPQQLTSDPAVNIGGVTEPYVNWSEGKYYERGVNVRYNNRYFRTTAPHTSTTTFDDAKFQPLKSLPIEGGQDAFLRRQFFTDTTAELNYGTVLRTAQDVIDFIQGYEHYLLSQGFIFDYFNRDNERIENWRLSVYEFLFWTTQNWNAGTVLTVSPGASQVKLNTEYEVVDDLNNTFYPYSLLKADGKKLRLENKRVYREGNTFVLQPKDTTEGIFNVKLPLVQKEHVVLLDNRTVFGDVIYDLEPGYRQERIRVLGYRSDNWNGSFEIPGFVYDDVRPTDWESWKDYKIGDVVRFKEYYYVAKDAIPGTEKFEASSWSRLQEKPEAKLRTNYDYKINQFADFYDLDTDNFDTEQQKFAQHLIGYQNREYLANIINDDVSQYKFYQGMILEKGTRNAFDKLFDALNNSDKDSLEFYEEWAVRVGQYGATSKFEEVEFVMDESKFRLNPQPIELTNTRSTEETDLVFRILPSEVYLNPEGYTHAPFPLLEEPTNFLRTSGYVREDDVKFRILDLSELLTTNINGINKGDYIWTVFDKQSWNVYKVTDSEYSISAIIAGGTEHAVQINKPSTDINPGDYIGLDSVGPYSGFFKVTRIQPSVIYVEQNKNINIETQTNLSGRILVLKSARAQSVAELNDRLGGDLYENEKVWVDNDGINWQVLQNAGVYQIAQEIINENPFDSTYHGFGEDLSVTDDNTILAVGTPGLNRIVFTGQGHNIDRIIDDVGQVAIYSRTVESTNLVKKQVLTPPENISAESLKFGSSVALSPDGEFLVVGSNSASQVRTKYVGNYQLLIPTTYNKGDIVKFNEQLWVAVKDLPAATGSRQFTSFNSYPFLVDNGDDSSVINLLVTGYPTIAASNISHVLVQAPVTMFDASTSRYENQAGDKIVLNWNEYTTVTPGALTFRQPFGGQVSNFHASTITGTFEIIDKVEKIIEIASFTNLPTINSTVITASASARVVDYKDDGIRAVIYLSDINGIFVPTGDLTLENGAAVGEYQEIYANTLPTTSGYWYINTNAYSTSSTFEEQGYGLVIQDFIKADDTRNPNVYYNVLDTVYANRNSTKENDRASFITPLTYFGDPYTGTSALQSDDRWVMRMPFELGINVGTKFKTWFTDRKDVNGDVLDLAPYGFTQEILNKEQTVVDVWDGYIDFIYDGFNLQGNPFEPAIGDIIRDVQVPFEQNGGISTTQFSNTSRAEVVFYKRQFNSVRLYIKILDGDWEVLPDTALFRIERLANTDLRGPTDVNRLMGTCEDPDADISIGNGTNVGKLAVFREAAPLPVPVTELIDKEYWIYRDVSITGQGIDPSIPSSVNRDWTKTNKINAVQLGNASEYSNQGLISIYRKTGYNEYDLIESLISPDAKDDEFFGDKVKIFKNNDLYTVLVTAKGNSTNGNSGKLYIIKYGTEGSTFYNWEYAKDKNFRGLFQIDEVYRTGELVIYDNKLYRAITNSALPAFDQSLWEEVTDGVDYLGYLPNMNATAYLGEEVFDPDSGVKGFALSLDTNSSGSILILTAERNAGGVTDREVLIYRQTDSKYFLDQSIAPAVATDKGPISSIYNLPPADPARGVFPTTPSMSTSVDGYPTTAYEATGTSSGNGKGQKFYVVVEHTTGKVLDINVTDGGYDHLYGDLITIKDSEIGNYGGQDITFNVVISDSTHFGESIAISSDGLYLAIGEPSNDLKATDQGKVHVYKQVSGTFELIQTLFSPNNEVAEKFGLNVAFSGNNLLVSSLNADTFTQTTFDIHSKALLDSAEQFGSKYVNDTSSDFTDQATTFDNEFTTFKNYRADTGIVYSFEVFEGEYLFAERIIYENAPAGFGTNLISKYNHIYAGMPRLGNETYEGTIVDIRKPLHTAAWSVLREPVQTVDVHKIKSAYLYNKKTSELVTYLDIVDSAQGKIPSVAEQEISYKTYYDPALYNIGPVSSRVNTGDTWGSKYVGKVWWNLNSTKFINAYQGDSIYQSNSWNKILPRTTVDVFEWVESKLTPSEWDRISGTEEGFNKGVTGTTRYGDAMYSSEKVYDSVSQTFTTKYYFWVKNKTTIPTIESRKISVRDISELIAFPKESGYQYLAIASSNRIIIHNCNNLIKNKDIVLGISYYTADDIEQNIHTEYQILTEGLASSKPKKDLIKKCIDSLVGYDENNRPVPDPDLSPKQRYGTLFKPRQGWFINRVEALKQVIERVNAVIKEKILVDEFDLSPLFKTEPLPSVTTKLFDRTISTSAELKFVGTAKLKPAKLTPVIEDGKLVRVIISDPGRGYVNSPKVNIIGTGNGAEVELVINNLGIVTAANVIKQGRDYTEKTTLSVRRFSVLVESDTEVDGKWAIYNWNEQSKEWFRGITQAYDITRYWDYIDWYAEGYNQFAAPKYTVGQVYELFYLKSNIGDLIKVDFVGSGGWMLLEKIDNQDTFDYTINYKVVGRQNGTIQFSNRLYDSQLSNTGFDSFNYDKKFYDVQPVFETRAILEALQTNIFVDDLEVEYNKLFFAMIRYVLSEQLMVDWVFKTSFVKAKHNLGELRQDITFRNDNLSNYQKYVEEVKPYKTQIREFLSSYEKTDNTNTIVSDFDLQPIFYPEYDSILPVTLKVLGGEIRGLNSDFNKEPYKQWTDNVGYKVTEIKLYDSGSGYTEVPVIRLIGGSGTGATAKAFVSAGRITSIKVTNPGYGYISAPEVVIDGSVVADGRPGVASALIGDSVIRTASVKIKFDRISGQYYILDLQTTESFVGTGNKTDYVLKWPMDLKASSTEIFVNGVQLLRSEYTFENVDDNSKGHTRQIGKVYFTDPPVKNATIQVHYKKSLDLLDAQDRIYHAYNPGSGMLGKSLGQLMDGIDYGGVEVKSFDFAGTSGWDADLWYTSTWDSYDVTFEDEIFVLDGSTTILELANPLENGIVYNVYRNGVRIDDPFFGELSLGQSTLRNPNAEIKSITGDGVTQLFDMVAQGITFAADDVIIIRKTTSDGSFLPDVLTYDTQLQGGTFVTGTASGLNAEDIIVDGDGFVTPTTSKGPEELVPGHVVDTLDIKVFDRPGDGSSTVYSQNYKTDGVTDTFALGIVPVYAEQVFVSLNNNVVTNYTIDYKEANIKFSFPPAINQTLSIQVFSRNGENILDVDTVTTDGTTDQILTKVMFKNVNSFYITKNGVTVNAILLEATDGKAIIKLPEIPAAGSVISYGLFYTEGKRYSQITKDVFIGDGSTVAFELAQAPMFKVPERYNTIVTVGNKLLNAGYNIKYTIPETRDREYQLETWQQPLGSLDADIVDVYLNGERLIITQSWRLNIFNSSVILFDDVGEPGDIIEIFVTDDGDYLLEGTTLTLDTAPNPGETVEVYQFTNHDILDIERFNYDNVVRDVLTVGSDAYYKYVNLTNGLIELRKPALDAQYVWVAVDGILLNPSVDYYITPDNNFVQLRNDPPADGVIEVIQFASETFTERFAYRQFKDMLNRTHYKRIDNVNKYSLTTDLNYYDLRIELNTTEGLFEPNREKNLPGVVFINGERIEYFVKEATTLRHLRRGTLGTGVLPVHSAGSKVIDQSSVKTAPYKDETLTQVFTGNGSNTDFILDFTPSSVNEFEVFVAGRRLRKNELAVFNQTLEQDSPEGDVIVPPEFAISGNTLQLAVAPANNTKIIVVRRIGKMWAESGVPLKDSQSSVAKFFRAGISDLPE